MNYDRVFRAIDHGGIVDLTRKLVQIPSINPPGDYEGISGLLRLAMEEIGLDTAVIEGEPGKPNVFGLLKSQATSDKTILLSGHMDVVGPGDLSSWRYEPFSATVAEGAVWGRGTVDMKGAIAAEFFAIKAIKETLGQLPIHVMLGATVDDETAGAMGNKYVMEKGLEDLKWPKPTLHVLGEANDLNITGVFKGRIWIEVALQGKTAHGGAPDEGVNAIEKILEFYYRLKKLPLNQHPQLGKDTLNLGTIMGGTSVNVVPDECIATFDYRTCNWTAAEAKNQIQSILEEFIAQDSTFSVKEFSLFENRDPVGIDPKSAEVEVICKAISHVRSLKPDFLGSLSAGDAYHSMRNGIPGVWVGPGDTRLLHAANEHILIEDLLTAAKVYAAIILNYAGLEV